MDIPLKRSSSREKVSADFPEEHSLFSLYSMHRYPEKMPFI